MRETLRRATDECLSRAGGPPLCPGRDLRELAAGVALEMFTHGVFADERALRAWEKVEKERRGR
jgi:hypothetical protein